MKTIQGKGSLREHGPSWIALAPDDATSACDERAVRVTAPADLSAEAQQAWLEGYAAAVKRLARYLP